MSGARGWFSVAGFPSVSWRGLAAALAGVITLMVLMGCGSGEQGASEGDGAQPAAEAANAGPRGQEAPALKAGSVFTIDDVAAAGWKKSKQFDATSVPSAREVWYGFFDRRDIEVRVYASHADALGPGAQSAMEAIGKPPPPSARGMITSGTGGVRYQAYLVVGNLVLLCQQDAEACLRLAEKMPGK